MSIPTAPYCLEAERLCLEQVVCELAAENERLKRELAEVRQVRDDYLAALRALDPAGIYTEEDLREAIRTGISSEELFRELEQYFGK